MPRPDTPDQDPTAHAAWFEVELIERLVADRLEGGLRDVDHYLGLYPGHPDAVARVMAEFTAEPGLEGPSDRLGPWTLIEELGRGGQATVWLAEDTRILRRVALKVFEPSVLRSGEQEARLKREAEAAAALEHPAICTILEVGEDGGRAWIAMQLVQGETLARHLGEAREAGAPGLDVSSWHTAGSRSGAREALDHVLQLVEEIARGVAAAHEARIVHRDLKPGNVMISTEGRPVVLDFGLAHVEGPDAGASLTLTGEIIGTPAYMAPEQLAGERPDARTDVWALGAILHECLTLRRPFEAPTFEALRSQVMHATLDTKVLRRSFPRDVVAVLEVALEKDRNRRYATAEAFAEDLRRLRAREPVLAQPAGWLLRTWRWSQRHPVRATAMLAGLLLATTVVTALVDRSRRLSEIRAERDQKQRNLEAWARLADAQRWRELLRRRDALWPARPEHVAAMDAWIREAEDVRSRLEKHRATLEALIASAATYSAEDQATDEAENRRRLVHLTEELAFREAQVDTGADTRDPNGLSRDEVLARIAELKHQLAARRTWRFAPRGADFRHRALVEFQESVQTLPEHLAEMKARRETAATIAARTIDAHRAAWAEAASAGISPQVGLVPLGPDPDSGLQEFAHVESGVAPARDPQTKKLVMTEEAGLVFVLIPEGTYRIGSEKIAKGAPAQPHASHLAEDIDGPVHDVRLDAFFLSKYEMTVAQWKRVTGIVPNFALPDTSHQGTEITWRHPVTRVSWNDCKAVLGRLGLDLPTEKQWEAACRGRSTGVWSFGDRQVEIARHGNTTSRGDDAAGYTYKTFKDGFVWTAPVGTFRPNPFGLFDVHGNVSEWCRDSWNIKSYGAPAVDGEGTYVAPWDPNLPRSHRGGAFTNTLYAARSSARTASWGHSRNEDIGVRPMRRVTR